MVQDPSKVDGHTTESVVVAKHTRSTKTIVLSLGTAIASIGSMVLGMVLSRMLTKEEWGTYRQTMLVFALVAPVLALGVSKSLFFFLPSSEERNRGILLESLAIVSITGLGFLLFMVFGGNELVANSWENPTLKTTLLIIAPLAVFQLLLACAGPCFVSSEKVSLAAAFTACARISIVVCVVATILFTRDVKILVAANVVATGVFAAIAVFLMLSVCKNGRPSFSGAQAILTYGVPLGIGTMVTTLSRNIDRSMVSAYRSTAEYAVFDNGALEIPLISIVTGSMTSILLVDYRKMLNKPEERSLILPLLHRAMIKSGTVLIPAMVFLLFLAPEFMVCVWGSDYRDSATVFRVYLLMLPIRTFAVGAIGLAAGRTFQLAAIPFIALAVNVVLNYFAIHVFGVVGCAIATVIVVYFVNGLGRAWIAADVLDCRMRELVNWSDAAKLFCLSAIPAPSLIAVVYFLSGFNSFLVVGVAAAVYFLAIAFLFSKFGLFNISATMSQLMQRVAR